MRARLFLAGALAVVAVSSARGFEVVKAGKPVAAIVVAEKAPEPERFAASELQACIEKATGARLPIASKMPAGGQPVILVGRNAVEDAGDKRLAVLQLDQLRDDGYSVAIFDDPAAALIVGKEPRATLHAIYDLMEQELRFGFFVDGDYVPRQQDVSFSARTVVGNPAFADRTYYVPLSIYGPKRFEAGLWTLEDWKAFLRWMAKKGMNCMAVPFTSESRAWGAAFDAAFPEAKSHRQEVLADVPDPSPAPGARAGVTARMGWGLHPDTTTAVLKEALQYARQTLGLRVTYLFVYGDYEQALQKAMPNLKWRAPLPSDRVAVAGGSCTLAASEPKARELQAKLWKAVIDTYGTDHRYVVTGLPLPDPIVSTGGAENVLAPALEALRAADPAAKVLVPTSEAPLWGDTPDAQKAFIEQLPEAVKLLYMEPGLAVDRLFTTTERFAGRAFEYGCPWGGGPGNHLFENRFTFLGNLFRHQQFLVPTPKATGVWNWNELRGVNPMMDDLLADFACSSGYVWRAEGAATNRAVNSYLERRYGPAAVFPMAEAYKQALRGAPMAGMEANFRAYLQGESAPLPGSDVARAAVALALACKAQAGSSPFYETDLVDLGRNYLHKYIHEQCAEALALVRNAKRAAAAKGYSDQVKNEAVAKAQKVEARLGNAHKALTRLIATRKDMCLGEAILEATATKGANKLLAQAIREHQSGLLAKGCTVVDSIEYHEQLASRQLRFLADYAKRELGAPTADAVPGGEVFFLQGAAEFVEKGEATPYEKKAEKTPASTILQAFLEAAD